MLREEEAQALVVLRAPGRWLKILHSERVIGEPDKELVARIGGRRGFRRRVFLLFSLFSILTSLLSGTVLDTMLDTVLDTLLAGEIR